MTGLAAELSALARRAFAAEGLAEELGQVLASDRPDLAQFQCNGALAAAKIAKTNPRALAQKIVDRLKAEPIFAKVEIAGPGFINLDVTDEALVERAAGGLQAPAPNGKSAVIDFGGANIAKPMHVGHLRSAILGDCLQRLFRANGWAVTSDVHLGRLGPADGPAHQRDRASRHRARLFRRRLQRSVPGAIAGDDWTIWRRSIRRRRRRARPTRRGSRKRRQATADLQAGRPATARCGSISSTSRRSASTASMEASGSISICGTGEASVDPLVDPMIVDLKARGLTEEEDGALVIRIDRRTTRKRFRGSSW